MTIHGVHNTTPEQHQAKPIAKKSHFMQFDNPAALEILHAEELFPLSSKIELSER